MIDRWTIRRDDCRRKGLQPVRALRMRLALGLLGMTALSGCSGVLDPQGPVGAQQKSILFNSLAIMLAIVIPTIIATLVFAWWFREGNDKAKYRPDFAYSGRVEAVTWSIPILTILFLGGITWVGSHDLDPYKPLDSDKKPVEVQVVALDWKWLFIYPEQNIATVNQLTLPAGTPVHFNITSASVLNTFFIPQLGSMIYAMNGMQTQLHLQADKPGTFHGLSGHFSGDGFPGMHFDVRAVPEAEFASWVQTAQANGPSLDRGSYDELKKQSFNDKPSTFRSAEAGLFEAIVTQKIPSGPGPIAAKGGAEERPATPGRLSHGHGG